MISETDPYESPSASAQVPRSVSFRGANRYGVAFDFAIATALFVFSWIAVSMAYRYRFDGIVYAVITLLALVLPVCAGLVRKRTSTIAIWLTLLLVTSCPIVYIVADFFEQGRDAIFLGISATTLFVSSAWTAAMVLARKRFQALLSGAISVCSGIAIAIMITIFMFFV